MTEVQLNQEPLSVSIKIGKTATRTQRTKAIYDWIMNGECQFPY